MIRILKLCTNVGLNVFIQSMIVGFASPKKSFRDSFAVCVLVSSVQKMHLGEKMQFGDDIVVGGD